LSKRRQRSTLIKVNPDGTIKERYRVLVEDDFDPRDGYIEIHDPGDKVRAARPIQDILYKNGKVVEKPVVHVVVKKQNIEADGSDETEVNLVGVPHDVDEVDVKIGNEVHKVNPKEPFYVNTTHPQQIAINVVTKTLKSMPGFVRGVNSRSKINA